MSELKRDIGCGIVADAQDGFIVLRAGSYDPLYLNDEVFQNLIAFHAYVQTELASRQRLEPLPEIPPITTVLKRLTP